MDHPRTAFGGLCNCVKFGSIQCSGFDNSLHIWLENAYLWPLFGFFGAFGPYIRSDINETPKRHILVWKDVVWRIDRQNRSTGVICARDEETKKGRQKNFIVAYRVLAQTTHVVKLKSKSVKWYLRCRGQNLALPITLAVGIYNSLYYLTSRHK